MDATIKFYIKRPREKERRKSFSIIKRTTYKDGRLSNESIHHPALESINMQFLLGVLTSEDAIKNIKKLVNGLYRDLGLLKPTAVFNNDNQKILDSYWKSEYVHRDINLKTAYTDFTRVIRLLGNTSIVSASQSEIQQIANQFKGDHQRRIVGRLNSILKYLNRHHEVKLRMARRVRPKVKYWNDEEFLRIITLIEPYELKVLCKVCFYTGVRLGEAFAIERNSLKPNKKTIAVETQMDEDDEEKPPKWGSTRPAYIRPEGIEAIEEWIKIKSNLTMSRNALRKRLKTVCQKLFVGDVEKHGTFKELRHSYAIALLMRNVGLSLIAQSMGNSEAVCQRYYAGFQLNPDTIEAIDNIIKKV